jgi:NAD-dependent SIR2 family protein deacetylase
VARTANAKIIEINVDETLISREVDCSLRGPAGEILPRLMS